MGGSNASAQGEGRISLGVSGEDVSDQGSSGEAGPRDQSEAATMKEEWRAMILNLPGLATVALAVLALVALIHFW